MAGEQLGMPLLDGLGLSTQIGDLASFFLTLGSCMLLGLVTGNQIWFYPPMMLLGFAAISRTLAWLIHDAAFPPDVIAVETVLAVLLYVASTRLARQTARYER